MVEQLQGAATTAAAPYYLRSFEAPLLSVYQRYSQLWLPHEHELFQRYQKDLQRDDKLVFIKLLLRSHNNIYELAEVADRYWSVVNWRQAPTDEEISTDKKRIEAAVRRLVGWKYLTVWTPEAKNQRDDVNALKSLPVQSLKTILQGLPEGKECLKKYKKKDELIVWLVERLEKFGHVANPFTRKTFSQTVWERFHKINGAPADSQIRFLVAKDASRFFKRLHLLNHVFVATVSPTGAGADAVSERIESILTDSLKPGVLEEIGSLEYVKSSKASALGIVSHVCLFTTRAELESYEYALGIVQEVRVGVSTMAAVRRLGDLCVLHLLLYVQSLADAGQLVADEVPGQTELLAALTAEKSSPIEGETQQPASSHARIRHHVFRRFTPEYLYSVALYELGQLLETGVFNEGQERVKDHALAVQWFSLILLVRATRMNRGKIYLRIMIDLRLHLSQSKVAALWSEKALTEIASLEPGFVLDIAKQISQQIGRKIVAHSRVSVKRRASEDDSGCSPTSVLERGLAPKLIEFSGIYKQLEWSTLTSPLVFAHSLVKMEKEINAAIPIKVLRGKKLKTGKTDVSSSGLSSAASSDIEGDVVAASSTASSTSRSVSRALVNSKFHWNGEWLSVEHFALQNYLHSADDEFIMVAKHGVYSERNKLVKKRLKTEVIDIDASSKPKEPSEARWVGCHCEGGVVREIASLLLFPVVFNARVCAANADAFITDAQVASCDLGTVDFYETRKATIHGYLSLWERLESQAELAFLLSFISSQLFEVRVMSATWSLDVNHPQAFRPELPLPVQKPAQMLPPMMPRPSPNPPTKRVLGTTPRPTYATPRPDSATLRKTPTSKWQTPRFKGRPPLRKIGDTNVMNLILGYDRGVSLLPGERLEVAVERRFESGLAYGNELSKVACGIKPAGLAQIMLHLCKCFPYWQNGLPDLLLWKTMPLRALEDPIEPTPAPTGPRVSPICAALLILIMDASKVKKTAVEKELGLDVDTVDLESWLTILTSRSELVDLSTFFDKQSATWHTLRRIWASVAHAPWHECATVFAEVKGPGDALSQKQRLWLYAMLASGLNAHVCEVRSTN